MRTLLLLLLATVAVGQEITGSDEMTRQDMPRQALREDGSKCQVGDRVFYKVEHVTDTGIDIWYVCEPKLETIDVSAGTEKYLAHHKGDSCDRTEFLTHCYYGIDVYENRPICSDKRRVKMQSEDGAWHCILFPKDVK